MGRCCFGQIEDLLYRTISLTTGVQLNRTTEPTIHLGLAKTKGSATWGGATGYGMQLSYTPVQDVYGLHANAWTSWLIAFGISVNYQTNFNKNQENIGLQPLVGFNLPFFNTHEYDNLQILYGYQFNFGNLENISSNSLTIRYFLSLKNKRIR